MNTTGLKIFDTKTRKIEEVTYEESHIGVYCCGPTVYRDAHVGNLRTFLLNDLIVRTLEFLGHRVKVIQNITDVGHMSEDIDEDKMLTQSLLEKRDPFEIARDYESKFHADLAHLGIQKADLYPRASETIFLMTELIQKLIDQGNAYISEGSVYFDSQSFPTYGAISGNRLDELHPGHRYEYTPDDQKKFHADWALWKRAGHRSQMIWDSPWGVGFPGWHIECSAMSLHYLNQHVDVHVGGIDLRFPHHENERAQSNSATGTEVVSRWVHGEHLLFNGRKMSKSSENVLLVSDVIDQGIDPLALRLCFLENRYRSQMDLTWEAIEAAQSTLLRWRRKIAGWNGPADISKVEIYVTEIAQDILADLDFPRAIIKLRKIERDESVPEAIRREIFKELDSILGLDLARIQKSDSLSLEEKSILLDRAQARLRKDFKVSDVLRNQLLQRGITVRDTDEGQKWERN